MRLFGSESASCTTCVAGPEPIGHGVTIEPKHWKKVDAADELYAQRAVPVDFAPALRTLNEARKKAVYEGEEPDLGDQSLEDLAIDIELAVDLAERGAS
jgi:hypothetical protein